MAYLSNIILVFFATTCKRFYVINENEKKETINKKEVSAIEIKGIVYYVDNNGNVYDTEDIIGDKKNARIIAKYEKDGEKYKIPSIFD